MLTTSYSALLGRVVASLRQRQGKEQSELADQLHISQASYSRLEGGKASWTIDQLMAASGALGVDVREILHILILRADELQRAGQVAVVPAIRGNSRGAADAPSGGAFLIGAALGGLLATLISDS